MIPRLIHQIWLGATSPEPPPQLTEASATWQARNAGWRVRRWSASDLEALVAATRPDLLGLYRAYPHWVQRADAARYVILHEFGGVYADLDVACAGSLDAYESEHLVLAPTRPFGVSNDFMMAEAGHPVFEAALGALPVAYRRWHRAWIPPYLRVMSTTGPLFLSSVFRRVAPKRVRLLTADEYGHGDPEAALVRHLEGSTWHDWDGRAIAALGRLLP